MALIAYWFLILVGLPTFALDEKNFEDQFSVQEIAPQTFVLTDKFYHDSNIMAARFPDGSVIVASSPFETEGTTLLVQWIQKKWNPRKIVAVNTHFHSDGTGGNEAYKKAGAEIWSSDLTDQLLRKMTPGDQKALANGFSSKPELKKRILKRKTVFADHTFSLKEGKVFEFGGEKVVLKFPGEGHAPDNVVVYLPKRKVLFGTCLIRSAKHDIGYLGDANLKTWAASVRSILDLKPQVVIPGHGPTAGPELLTRTIDLAEEAAKKKL